VSQKRSLFALLAEQRRFVYLAVTVLSGAGIWSALHLASAIYPELNFSRVTVVVEASSLGARQVMFSITRPIEEAIAIVPGVTRVQSRSIRGGSETNITFAPKTDMIYALQQVQARVNQARSAFPAGLDIEVERLTPSLFPIISYNLEGGDPAALYDLARHQIKPIISRVSGVGRVDVQGSDVREIEVIADPARLAAQQMTFADLAAAIQASTTVDAVGRMPKDYRQYLIVTAGEAHSTEDIANIVVSRGLRVARSVGAAWLRIDIDELRARRVDVKLAPGKSSEPLKPPADLQLPVELAARSLRIGELFVGPLGAAPLRDVQAQLELGATGGTQHRIDALSASWDRLRASGHAQIASRPPFALTLQLSAQQDAA